MNYYLAVLKKYATFSGRARRKEYWMFTLFHIIILIIAAILDNMLGLTFGIIKYGYIYVFYTLAVLLPALAVTVRRLHDVGKSGWFLFIGLIPIIGSIWLLVLACKAGEAGENAYGEDPKGQLSVNDDALDSHLTT